MLAILFSNGRFGRIGGEHGHEPEMTSVSVLPTLEPFKIIFRRVFLKSNDFRAEFWAGER